MRAKRKLLFITAFTALISVGAFAGVSLSKEAAKPAEAAWPGQYYDHAGSGRHCPAV